MKPTKITGTITMTDGSTHLFSIMPDIGWQQWGAPEDKLADTCHLLDLMTTAIGDELVDDEDEDDEEAGDEPD